MRQENFTYADAESCFLEVMRQTPGSASEYARQKEGNALIDPERTKLNMELIDPHPALSWDDDNSHRRGQGIADYHKEVTGRSARMKGPKNQLSKAVGLIATLPRDCLDIDFGLTDEEYDAIEQHTMTDNHDKTVSSIYKEAMSKILNHQFTDEEITSIRSYFQALLNAWLDNAGIRDEDVLYAVIHMDESWPHLHVMALPTLEKDVVNKETGEIEHKITFSTGKFNNYKTHYFDCMHQNIIEQMAREGIDASGLLNGATKGRGFIPSEFTREQRAKGVELSTRHQALVEHNKELEQRLSNTRQLLSGASEIIAERKNKVDELNGEIKTLTAKRNALRKDILLTEEQNKKLAKNTALQSIIPGEKITISVTSTVAQSIKNGDYIKKSLDNREKELSNQATLLSRKSKNLEHIIENRIKEGLPADIQHYRQEIIPSVNAKEAELIKREERIQESEQQLKTQCEALMKQQQTVENLQRNLEVIVERETKKRLTQILSEKVDAVFNALRLQIFRLFEGRHQRQLLDAIGKLNLPEDFKLGKRNYGGKTIERALIEAETLDIKEALHKEGISYADMDGSDIGRIRKALLNGDNKDAIIKQVAEAIHKNLR